MAQIRCMFVGQGASNLPEDRFVNTWHFVTAGTYSSGVLDVVDALGDFYGAVGGYIQGYVKRVAEFRCYDLSTATPRTPTVTTYTLPATVQAGGLPEECAVCMSFHGAPPLTARRRGRIYLGPLVPGVVDTATTLLPARVGNTFRTAVVNAAEALRDANIGWSIYSTASELFVPVVAGWVDDAVDIQRRRGGAPSIRSTWD